MCLWKHWSTTAMSERLNQHTGGQWRVWCEQRRGGFAVCFEGIGLMMMGWWRM